MKTEMKLGRAALAFRVAHAAWAVVGLASLAYVWASAATRRRDRATLGSVGFLAAEGIALLIGRGNCPLGPFQRSLGDPLPLFELVLPPRAAKAAIPVLAGASLAGLMTLAARLPARAGDIHTRRIAATGGRSAGSDTQPRSTERTGVAVEPRFCQPQRSESR